MDFKYKDYYIFNKMGYNSDIPRQIKRYFKCKIHCKYYIYEGIAYFNCVSIDKEDSKRLLSYLDDHHIEYHQITTPPKRKDYCTLICKEKELPQSIVHAVESCNQVEEHYKRLERDYVEMLSEMTEITDLDIIGIKIIGYDGEAHENTIATYNHNFINCFVDMCKKELKENKL